MTPANVGRGQIGRSALWSLIEASVSQILVLAVFLVTARFVEPSDFGILATTMLIVELFRQVVIEGAVTAVNTQRDPTDEDYNACFFLVLTISTLFSMAIFFSSKMISDLTAIPHLAVTLKPISILIFTLGLSRTHEAYLSRHLEFRTLAIRSLVSILIGGSTGIWLAVHGYGLTSLIVQQLLTAVISLVLLWIACPWRPKFKFDLDGAKKILRYAKHVSATGATNFANNQADIAFTSMYLGSTDTGFYNAAKRIGFAINQIIATSLNRVALPTFAKVYGDVETSQRVFLEAVGLTSLLTAPIFAGLAVIAPEAIHLALGDRWLPSASILSIISLSYFLTTIGQYNQSVILVGGKPHWQTLLTATYAAANMVLFFFVVRFGVIALAVASTLRAVVFLPLSIGLALRLLQIRWRTYLNALFPAVAAAAIMAVILWVIRLYMLEVNIFTRLLTIIPLGAFIYIISLWFIRRAAILEILRLGRAVVQNR